MLFYGDNTNGNEPERDQLEMSDAEPTETPEDTVTEEANPYLLTPKENWVHFGNSPVLRKLVKSRVFYPTYVVGQQGAGKTELLLQLHAEEKKPVILVSITPETDEDDLIGSLSLTIDHATGQTVTGWEDGPVLIAMKNGYSLILDEVDTGGNLQSLFPVLTGQSIFVKRIKQRVVPAPGFTVFATANTRGKGSVDGRFTSAQVQSVAFVDRFKAMIEQDYPDATTERKILTGSMGLLDQFGVQFHVNELSKVVKLLVDWAAKIRESFKNGVVEETLSTRKLISIVEGLAVFESLEKAIEVNLNSLDPDTAKAFQATLKTLAPEDLKVIDKKLFVRQNGNSNASPRVAPPVAPPSVAVPNSAVAFRDALVTTAAVPTTANNAFSSQPIAPEAWCDDDSETDKQIDEFLTNSSFDDEDPGEGEIEINLSVKPKRAPGFVPQEPAPVKTKYLVV